MAALRWVGAALLVLAGTGAGLAAAAGESEKRRRMYAFRSFLQWLLTEIQYCAAPADLLLELAAQNGAFAQQGAAGHRPEKFADLPVPEAFSPALRGELRDILCQLSSAPRAVGCTALRRAAELCRAEEAEQREKERAAQRLYPRLGACAGILAALLLL